MVRCLGKKFVSLLGFPSIIQRALADVYPPPFFLPKPFPEKNDLYGVASYHSFEGKTRKKIRTPVVSIVRADWWWVKGETGDMSCTFLLV